MALPLSHTVYQRTEAMESNGNACGATIATVPGILVTLAGKFTENQQTGHQGDNQKVEDSKPKPQLVIRILTSTNQKDPNGTQCTSKQKQCTSKQKQGWVGISFSDSLELNSVLYVPNLSCNLLSVRKLTKDLNCTAKFFPSCCEFQDLSSGRTIRKARECDGLYYYEDSAVENGQSNVAGSELGFFSSNDEIMSWHFRLGHPNFLYLKSLFPALFGNKNVYDFQCEICQIAKSHKNTYPLRPHKVSQPFSLIHSDIWSPSRVPNLTNTKWFISFVDDHTQICWIYLLKEK